jgi:hypothetical protein
MQPDLVNVVLPKTIGPGRDTQETASKTDAPSDLRMGVVTAVTARGITVQVGSQSHTAAHLDSYAPAIGDAVALMAVQDSWLAMGRVVGPGNPTDGSAAASAVGPSLLTGGNTTSLGSVTLASTSGGAVNVPRYDRTYFHPENHAVLAIAGFTWLGSTAATVFSFLITETTGGASHGLFRRLTGTTFEQYDVCYGVLPATLGGQNRRVVGQVSVTGGGGSATVKTGNGIGRGFFILMDLGDLSFIPEL